MGNERAGAYGYVWLNRIFIKRGSSFRLWKTSDIRLSRFEAVVIILLALILMGISVPIIFFMMKWSFISDHINLWPFIFVNLIIAWMLGRSVAKASPYSRHTGENIFQWLVVTSDKRNTLIGRVVGHRVATNEVHSWVDGKGFPRAVEAIEWIGSARAPSAPPRTADMDEYDLVPVHLLPRTEPTNWVEQVRAARRSRYYAGQQGGADSSVSQFSEPAPPPPAPAAANPDPSHQPPSMSQPSATAPVAAREASMESQLTEYESRPGVAGRVQSALEPEVVEFDPFYNSPHPPPSSASSADGSGSLGRARGMSEAEVEGSRPDRTKRRFGKRRGSVPDSSGREAGF